MHDLSGVVINQNDSPEAVIVPAAVVYQTFTLPGNYTRGDIIPRLTGIQVYAGSVDAPLADCALERYITGTGWQPLGTGVQMGSIAGDEFWLSFDFTPIALTADALSDRFRFSIDSTNLTKLWYAVPNPLSTSGDKAYAADGTTAIQDSGDDVSLLFRVLADVADDGRDFLGNLYRSAVIESEVSSVSTNQSDRDTFFLSAPQPSRFAVVSHYFDMRDTNLDAVVIDGVLIDPTTPGIYCNIYSSNDDEPGTDTDSWDNLLWTAVPQTYHLVSRTNLFFPTPVTAKYIKIEYSHLQAKYYAPGEFQKPITYKKYPKWVTDYFLARSLARNTEDPLIARRIQVIYDALDFAFSYYRDDLSTSPSVPNLDQDILPVLKAEDAAFSVDPDTLAKIRVAFQPYLNQPGLTGRSDYILGQYLNTSTPIDYPTEQIDRTRSAVDDVSSLEREDVLAEKDYPLMSFFITCRHAYRVSQALFSNDRAYFVGINEIAFTRERYDSRSDTPVYLETVGDLINVERNDFETVNFNWVTFNDR